MTEMLEMVDKDIKIMSHVFKKMEERYKHVKIRCEICYNDPNRALRDEMSEI
jgi:hypothetical protein